MASTNTMIKQCSGLIGTRDITPWEDDFLRNILAASRNGDRPDLLSPPRVETLEKIYQKHFAG